MILYHGSLNHNKFEENVFFSTDKRFAHDYGEVKQYHVNLGNIFDTANDIHVKRLIGRIGTIYDPYNDIDFSTYEEYEESGLLGMDNWEIFEQYISEIKILGFDSIRIFEGGCENYCVFNHNFKLIN